LKLMRRCNKRRIIRAIELLSDYKSNINKLTFVIEWLNAHKNTANKWDMGSSVKGFISFPLSDSWDKEARSNDCTLRIEQLISKINSVSAVLYNQSEKDIMTSMVTDTKVYI